MQFFRTFAEIGENVIIIHEPASFNGTDEADRLRENPVPSPLVDGIPVTFIDAEEPFVCL